MITSFITRKEGLKLITSGFIIYQVIEFNVENSGLWRMVIFINDNHPTFIVYEKKLHSIAVEYMRVNARLEAFKRVCSACGRFIDAKLLSRCARCKKARYCSKECQKDAWSDHKADCIPC